MTVHAEGKCFFSTTCWICLMWNIYITNDLALQTLDCTSQTKAYKSLEAYSLFVVAFLDQGPNSEHHWP